MQPVGGSTGRSSNGQKRQASSNDVNILVIISRGGALCNHVPGVNGSNNASTLPSEIVQPPSEHPTRTPSAEVISSGHEPLRLLASILRADDTDRVTTMNLHIPALKIEPKCKFCAQVTFRHASVMRRHQTVCHASRQDPRVVVGLHSTGRCRQQETELSKLLVSVEAL